MKSNPFPPDSPIGKWRDLTLSRPNPGAGKHIGEDFFYIQDVSVLLLCVSPGVNLTVWGVGETYRCARSRYVALYTNSLPRTCSAETIHQGVSLGVADGVGGWTESGIDPSLFSQALMYHAHRYSKIAWPGEPEVDPTQEYEEREQVEGWELSPVECLESAYGGVLRERNVVAGA